MVPTAERLAPFCRVYAPDLPGYGRSSKPSRTLDVAGLADALAAWASSVGLHRAVFLGNSFGCQIVVDLALRYPRLVERAVLVGPTVDPGGRTALQQIGRQLRDSVLERPSLWWTIALDLLQMGPRRAIQTFRVMLRDRIEAKLPRLDRPVLVVRGGRDPIATEGWVVEATRLLPQGRLAVLPGAPHAANYSAADALVAAVLPFILHGDAVSGGAL